MATSPLRTVLPDLLAVQADAAQAWESADMAAAARLEATLPHLDQRAHAPLAAAACLGIARARWRAAYSIDETQPWVDHGLALIRPEDAPLAWMRLTNFAAFLATERGAWAEAIPLAMAVRHAASGRDDTTGQALQATNNLAWVFWKLGDLDGARNLLEEACEEEAAPWFHGQALGDLVALCVEQGDRPSAEARFAELEACPIAEPRRTEVLELARARLLASRGDFAGCRRTALRQLARNTGLSDERLTLHRLAADATLRLGDADEAMALARAGLELADAHPSAPGSARLLHVLADAALEAGDIQAAREALHGLRVRTGVVEQPPAGTGVSALVNEAGAPSPASLKAAQLEVRRRALERSNAQLKAASAQAQAALAARSAVEAELRRGAMMEAAAQLAGGLAHRMNNLLTVIYDAAHRLRDGDREGVHRVAEILRASDEATAVVRRLQTLTLTGTRAVRDVDLAAMLTDAVSDLRGMLPESFTVALETDGPVWVRADPRELEHVVLNLTLNACRATRERGRVALTLSHEGAPGTGWAVLCVVDDGPGVPVEHRQRIFEPFFSTRDESLGSGLGLPVSRTMVEQAGGTLELCEEVSEGACFRMRLPLQRAPETAAPPAAPTPEPPPALRPPLRVLLVEDEPMVRAALLRQLARRGVSVIEAADGAEGLDLWAEHRDGIDAVVTDVVMPQLNGTEMAARILEEAPNTPVIILSGYTARTNVEALLERPHVRFLAKPFESRALLAALDEVTRTRG